MEVIKIKDHSVSPSYSYLFDTNVWMYINGPMAGSNTRKQSVYSGLLREIMTRKATVFVSSLILAEYINAVLRLGFKQWKRKTGNVNADFKHDYRPTDDYASVLQDAICQVQTILKVAEKRPDDFHRITIDEVLSKMDQYADHNDVYLAKVCEETVGMKIVSDDKDLQNMKMRITLITD